MKLTTSAILGAAVISAGMIGAIAPSASAATTTQHNYVHFPGSYAKTYQECTTTMNNFEKAVRASHGTVGGRPTNSDSELTSCFSTAKGWTYDVAYTRATPMFTQDMKVNGGFATSSIVGGLKLTQAQAAYFAQYTGTQFEDFKDFPTLAACQAAFNPIDAKLKAMSKAGQINYTTPGPEGEIGMDSMPASDFSCSPSNIYDHSDIYDGGPVKYGFNLEWSGPTNITYPTPGATTYEYDIFHSTYTDASGQQVMADGPQVFGKILDNGTWTKTN